MKSTNSGSQRGYNPIIMEGDVSNVNVDFDKLLMGKGDTVSYNEPRECIYVLVTGKVAFRWADEEEAMERKPCFREDPTLLHVPQNTVMELVCQSDRAEVPIQRTISPKHFEPKLMKGEDLLCGSELRGADLMNEASTRTVHTFLGRSSCPEIDFFIGEVVSYPGKWSGSPPHTHMGPEIYFCKFLPENGYGYVEAGDTVHRVYHNDATCVARGMTYSQATAPGYAEHYIWAARLRDNDPMVTTAVPERAQVTKKDIRYFPKI